MLVSEYYSSRIFPGWVTMNLRWGSSFMSISGISTIRSGRQDCHMAWWNSWRWMRPFPFRTLQIRSKGQTQVKETSSSSLKIFRVFSVPGWPGMLVGEQRPQVDGQPLLLVPIPQPLPPGLAIDLHSPYQGLLSFFSEAVNRLPGEHIVHQSP
jgi:hypothetical protein